MSSHASFRTKADEDIATEWDHGRAKHSESRDGQENVITEGYRDVDRDNRSKPRCGQSTYNTERERVCGAAKQTSTQTMKSIMQMQRQE